MRELIEQVLLLAKAAWRYRWIGIATAWTISILGWVVLSVMPDVYEARARVYVDTSSEISRLLQDQVLDPTIQEDLLYVRQSMLGSIQLEKVARNTDLLLAANTPEDVRSVIERLANNVEIQATAPRRNVPENLFLISYRNADPDVAYNVVDELLNAFIEDTLEQSNTDTSRKFLEEQIADYESRLGQAEQRLADFNAENYDRLPDQQGGYFERLQAETAEVEASERSLQKAESKRDSLVRQLRGEDPWVSEAGSVNENSTEARLTQRKIRREELLLLYTEAHPNVVAVTETIKRLEAQLADERTSLQYESTASNNPVYQALQISINEIEGEIAELQVDISSRKQKIQSLENLIDEISDVEAQSSRLNRDYNVLKARYQSLADSLERDRLSKRAYQTEEVEFRIIDPPSTDPEPVAPFRIALVPAIFLFGLAGGAGIAFLLSQIRPVIQNGTMVYAASGFPVLGSISAVGFTDRGSTAKMLPFFALLVSLFAVFGVVMVIEGLGPGFRALV